MGYEESLRQAKELLMVEIESLKEQLGRKEASLKKLDSFLREPGKKEDDAISLTQQIVELVFSLVNDGGQPVSAKAVVKEFFQKRTDVNESTIRSTLYQVTRKQKPTEIADGDKEVSVRVIKEGPYYDISFEDDKQAYVN